MCVRVCVCARACGVRVCVCVCVCVHGVYIYIYSHSGILAWKSHGLRSSAGLMDYSSRGCKVLDTTEQLTHTHTFAVNYAGKRKRLLRKLLKIQPYCIPHYNHLFSGMLHITFYFVNS